MYKTYERKPIEIVPWDSELDAIKRMVNSGLPAFIINHSSKRTKKVMARSKELLKEAGVSYISHRVPTRYLRLYRYREGVTYNEAETDNYFHVDNFKGPEDQSIGLNIHHTRQGSSIVMLAESKLPNVEAEASLRQIPHSKYNHIFLQGCIETDLYEPIVYTGELEPGSLLYFRSAGDHPMGHTFITTQYPRESGLIYAANTESQFR